MPIKNKIVIDLDNTLTIQDGSAYGEEKPNLDVVKTLHKYKQEGFEVAIYTARNMRTYNNNVGKLAAKTLPVIQEWLNLNDIPYDEIWVGKPWCGPEGFYVDDRAIRPNEFVNMTHEEINILLQKGSS